METNPEEYEAGIDQNQGVVGTMARNEQHGNTETSGTQVPQLDPNEVTDQDKDMTNSIPDQTTDTLGEQKYVVDEGND